MNQNIMPNQIKRPFQETEYTPDSVQDLGRCMKDPIYFIEKFVKVQHPTKGTVPMILYDYQKEMIDAIHNHKDTIILASRQLGKCVTGDTVVTTVLLPTGLKKLILKFINREAYDKLFS